MRKAKRSAIKPAESPPAEKTLLKLPFGYQVPPEFNAVLIYFDQKNLRDQARPFYDHYDQANWLTPKGRKIRNWKVTATNWIFNHRKKYLSASIFFYTFKKRCPGITCNLNQL